MSQVLRPKRWRTLRWKVAGLFVGLFSLGSICICLGSLYFFNQLSALTFQQTQSNVAADIVASIDPLLNEGASFAELKRIGAEVARYNPNISVYLLNEEGSVLLSLSPHTFHRVFSVPIQPLERFLNATLDRYPIYNTDPRDGGQSAFSVARFLYQGKPAYLYVTVNGSEPFDHARAVARENLSMAQGGALILGSYAGSIVLGVFSLALIARRFEKITETVRTYREGSFEARLAVTRDDELDQLAQAINEMAERIQSNITELERRDELRRELIANVSHDLRAPACHIRIACEELLDQQKSAVPDTSPKPARSIQSSVVLLEQMLRELFELANLEANSSTPECQYFEIGDLFDDLSLRFQTEAKSKQVQLEFLTSEQLPYVYADPALLNRALGNLIQNAIRYTHAGGSIVVSAAKGQKGVIIKISDSGVGISPEELPRLFQRYYRGDESRAPVAGSTGLGLAITKRIIELHGSSIFVESVVNKGTNFWFEISSGSI